MTEVPATFSTTLGLTWFIDWHMEILNPAITVPALVDVPNPLAFRAFDPGWVFGRLGDMTAAVTLAWVVLTPKGLYLRAQGDFRERLRRRRG